MAFTLGVRDSIMIAHSFSGAEFGPAQNMHGATYTVDCEFGTDKLVDGCNWVVDIGEALDALGKCLQAYNYKNLDELPQFKGVNTTTEFMCMQIQKDMAAAFKGKFSGTIKVTLHESHKAWASYTGPCS
ncbi:hypothetical protein FVE85_9755 [Porphyridium purpureum]|uniref:6-pyruvoyltetrahydropterin synthase n=1 Tax=Porphyridium purpureum TaxID=35688 RepID=A0A5J4YKC1_PORPP|nr:hypothetical protein FVE85_9755 [Porphyridium purpureum]|eukprot:POR5607..scf246_12